MQSLRAVLFDIGNVFVTWDPRFLYQKLINDPDELNFFLSEIVTLDWHTEHDRGRPFAEGVRLLANRFPEYEDLIHMFDSRWEETIGPVNSDTVDILERLSEQGVKVYALTNFSAEKWPAFRRSYYFTDLFEGVLVSGEVQLVKPDPRIYQIAMDRFDLDPEQTFFTDDRLDNIHAATQLGMIGHQFTTPKKLEAALHRHGFLY